MNRTTINSMVLVIILLLCSFSRQHPTFFKDTFKGLSGSSSRGNVVVAGEIRAVYYHEQTVAVVDLGSKNELLNCDIIEVYEPHEADELLRNLSMMAKPQKVSFQEIITLMEQCDTLDTLLYKNSPTPTPKTVMGGTRIINPFSLFSGILPGTKWCGTGDIAENYHDLGQEATIDRCCRMHDLCPVKVRARRTRYNLVNNALYSKSHCTCDDNLYQCLKSTSHPTANIMGTIYFNIVKMPCIEEIPIHMRSNNASSFGGLKIQFVPVKKVY